MNGLGIVRAALLVSLMYAITTVNAQSVRASYGPTKSPQYAQLLSTLRQAQVAEKMATGLSNGIRLPQPITLSAAECGAVNAYYIKQNRTLVLCLELMTNIIERVQRDRRSTGASDQDISRTASGALTFVLLHEMGHALIHSLALPVLGREEDAADQISAFLLLASKPQDELFGLEGALWFFNSKSAIYSKRQMSDEHSLNPQRQANLACWAYGKNPNLFRFVIPAKYLSPERAVRCAGEYAQLDSSIRQLLGKNIDFPAK